MTKSMKQHVWDSLEGYVFGSANDHQLPKHKMSGSQVRVDMKLTNPPQPWEGDSRCGLRVRC